MRDKKKLNINSFLDRIKSINKTELPNGNMKFDIELTYAENIIAYVNKNMEFHREDGPARIIIYRSSGKPKEEAYIINGKYSRKDGPAIIKYRSDGSICEESYEVYGILHRMDGPAYITYFNDGTPYTEIYYLFGERYDFNDDFVFAVYTASLKEIEEEKLFKLSQN